MKSTNPVSRQILVQTFVELRDEVLDACAADDDREAEVMKAVKERKRTDPALLDAHIVAAEDVEGGYVDSRLPPG